MVPSVSPILVNRCGIPLGPNTKSPVRASKRLPSGLKQIVPFKHVKPFILGDGEHMKRCAAARRRDVFEQRIAPARFLPRKLDVDGVAVDIERFALNGAGAVNDTCGIRYQNFEITTFVRAYDVPARQHSQ